MAYHFNLIQRCAKKERRFATVFILKLCKTNFFINSQSFNILMVSLNCMFVSGMFCWYENQFAIIGARVFAVCMSGSVPIWDAKTGKLLCYADSFTGPEKSISVAGSDVIIWTPMEAAVYRESKEQGLKLVTEKDLTSLGLEYLNCSNFDDLESDYSIQFIHRNLVGVRMIQNVCYTINDVNRECCTIKLAFVPMKDVKGKKKHKRTFCVLENIHICRDIDKSN